MIGDDKRLRVALLFNNLREFIFAGIWAMIFWVSAKLSRFLIPRKYLALLIPIYAIYAGSMLVGFLWILTLPFPAFVMVLPIYGALLFLAFSAFVKPAVEYLIDKDYRFRRHVNCPLCNNS
jgi:hypothetical protein